MTVHVRTLPSRDKTFSLIQKSLRTMLLTRLKKLHTGRLVIADPLGISSFGSIDAGGPLASIRITNPAFYVRLAFGGSLGAAESYMDGDWAADDLVEVIRLLVLNQEVMQSFEGGTAVVQKPAMALFRQLTRNTLQGSRRNIAGHYDLSNDLFRLFLDQRMMYSCAYYERDDMTLDEAQVARLDRICRRAGLKPGDHVLEIGTGWGGFAIHAARHYGCQVTTTTISEEQYSLARERIDAAGLADQIILLKKDYRDLTGKYDKVVSIEMIEAVGAEYLPGYLAKCADLLEDDGLLFLQAITINDQLYDRAVQEVDFIKKYIFPGSFIPSVSAILDGAKQATDLRLYSLDDITPHYARTLLDWRRRFLAHRDAILDMGFDEHFIRRWDYYFCYCAGGFLERSIGNVHLIFGKPGFRTDLSRDLIIKGE